MPGTSATKPMSSLAVWLVLIGAIAGIVVGLFFGDYAGALRPIGNVYAMLLEVAIYPYLICSLLHGLGRLTPADAWRLFAAAWKFYALFFVVIVAVLLALATGVPRAQPLSFVPPTAAPPGKVGLLQMLIPSDPFEALSHNYVPAVILFCIAFGIALQHVKEKEALLSVLESVRQASLAFWNGVVPFAPLAVFSLFAAEAGTLRLGQAESILVFLLLLIVGTMGLAFWVLPSMVAALTPLHSREMVGQLRGAFVIAVATSMSVAALPFVTSATQRLMDDAGVKDADRDDVIRTNLSLAYPLGQVGNYFVYLFMVFAATFYSVAVASLQQAMLPGVTLISCIGSPTSSVDAVTFLARWMGLPADTTAFYVGLMALTRYGQVVASVAGFAFLSFTVVSAYYGKLRVLPARLCAVLAAAVALALAAAWGGRALSQRLEARTNDPYLDLSVDPALTHAVKLAAGVAGPEEAALPGESTLSRIQRTGVLRVGVNASIIPFCYRNAAGALAGYDVSFAYRLAEDLNVGLRFVPFEWDGLAGDLQADKFDIAMSAIYVTEDRLAECRVSTPYFQSPLAVFLPRERAEGFRSRAEIQARVGVRLGVFNDPVLLPRMRRTFPNAEIVVLPDYATVPDFSKIDAAVWTLEQAEALASAHPGLVAVEPADAGNPYLFAYLMPPKSQEFGNFVNYWLELKKSEGFDRAQRNYWIHRQPRQDAAPRWSILRNVLGAK